MKKINIIFKIALSAIIGNTFFSYAQAQNYNSSAYLKNAIKGSGNATIGYVLCARNTNDCQQQVNYTIVHENELAKINFSLPYDFLFVKNISYKENGKTKTISFAPNYCSAFAAKPLHFSRLINKGSLRELIVCQDYGFIGESTE